MIRLRVWALSIFFCCCVACLGYAETLIEWDFGTDGDFEGWQTNPHVEDCKVSDSAISGTPVGHDPILVSPLFEIPASHLQQIEIRMKCAADGVAQVFWTNTTEGQYGGFSSKKTNFFSVRGDGKFHIYRIFPLWQTQKKIIHLRIDPANTGPFEIDWVRISEPEERPKAEKPEWDFTGDRKCDWIALQDASIEAGANGLEVATSGPSPVLLGPETNISADANFFVSMRMRVDKGRSGRVYFASDECYGLNSATFELKPDGRAHTYSVDVGLQRGWVGKIVFIGIGPSDVEGATAQIEWIKVGREPQGQPEVTVRYFGLSEAINRAGKSCELICLTENTGGVPGRGLTFGVKLPDEVSLQSEDVVHADALKTFDDFTAVWRVKAQRPMKGKASVEVTGENIEPIATQAELEFTPSPNLPKAEYVPKPIPVRSDYLVGVYYFPGWYNMSRWEPIFRFPKHKPALGWYEEGLPAVADWHIKWMVEHGISFIAYDWYWCRGARHLEHALHDGFLKARYRDMIKFCLLWANHNPPKTSSEEDLLKVTQFWIDHYFKLDNHLKVDGRPVMIIFTPRRLTSDMGSENVRAAFEKMDALCRRQGIPEIYMVACTRDDAGTIQQLKDEGYDAISGYNYHGLGAKLGDWLDYGHMVEAHHTIWNKAADVGILREIPAITPGWDKRPWRGLQAIVYTDNTPDRFKQHLVAAKEFLDKRDPKPKLNMCIIEAWNEFGEGSFIEPNVQYGFAQVDAVREVFTDAPAQHLDIVPSDVGLGPYTCPDMEVPTPSWEFNTAGDAEGWHANACFTEAVKDGVLEGVSTGRDPILSSPAVKINAADYPVAVVRMKSDKDTTAQLFWRIKNSAVTEKTSVTFDVVGDGKMHEYKLDLRRNLCWRGIINSLRFDPANATGVRVEIDYIRVLKEDS